MPKHIRTITTIFEIPIEDPQNYLYERQAKNLIRLRQKLLKKRECHKKTNDKNHTETTPG